MTPAIERFGAQPVLRAVGFLCQVALQPGFEVLLPVHRPVSSCHLLSLPKGAKIAWARMKTTGGRVGCLLTTADFHRKCPPSFLRGHDLRGLTYQFIDGFAGRLPFLALQSTNPLAGNPGGDLLVGVVWR